MRTRKEYEELENKILAPYAMKSAESSGRFFEEPQHEVRTCYQRDRDRIVHTEAFRKLEYKTQVFVIFEGDYYRTRLTHTIEVAQIARTIGRSLRLNEDLIEAIALAHDLGHPPFGHAGEYALNDLMKQYNQDDGFNHNLRSFEIVTQEKRYPDFDGLNLTEEVLLGILKHRTQYDEASEIAQYKNKGTTLEAQVVDIADSLAYLSHDIDDGITSGCLTKEDLMESVLWQKVYERVQDEKIIKDQNMLKYQIVKTIIDFQIKDLLHFSVENINNLKFQSSLEVRGYTSQHPDKSIIRFSDSMFEERRALQKLLETKLYHHYRVVRMTDKARRIINDLFEVYKTTPKQLPYNIYQRNMNQDEKEINRIICNYIASMTDRFALDEHKKLFDPYQKV